MAVDELTSVLAVAVTSILWLSIMTIDTLVLLSVRDVTVKAAAALLIYNNTHCHRLLCSNKRAIIIAQYVSSFTCFKEHEHRNCVRLSNCDDQNNG